MHRPRFRTIRYALYNRHGPMSAPPPSTRLLRAVAAERDQLERHRAKLAHEADALRRTLVRIEDGLAQIDERRALLDRVAAAGDDHGRAGVGDDRAGAGDDHGRAGVGEDRAGAGGEPPPRAVLRGPAIREAAVRVLVERGRGDALHYRDWYRLLTDAGYAIAGKDPLAVFLTQLGRSPAVRKSTRAGVYELDRHAETRHTARLKSLQEHLRELTAAPAGDLSAIRATTTEIGRIERALRELDRALRAPLAATG
jgi:hypothetical protein